MKKVLLLGIGVVCFLGVKSYAVSYSNLYSVTASTYAVTNKIVKGTSKLGFIAISNPSTQAQNVTIYKNSTSTTTITSVASFSIPGTVGMYYPLGTVPFTDSNAIAITDFTVETDTTTTPVIVNIIYR